MESFGELLETHVLLYCVAVTQACQLHKPRKKGEKLQSSTITNYKPPAGAEASGTPFGRIG